MCQEEKAAQLKEAQLKELLHNSLIVLKLNKAFTGFQWFF